jgi:hypothetical protein
MIYKHFVSAPMFLGITLLISCFQARQSQQNQALGWIAYKKSKNKNPSKSNT